MTSPKYRGNAGDYSDLSRASFRNPVWKNFYAAVYCYFCSLPQVVYDVHRDDTSIRVTNMCQKPKRYLFICSVNRNRSKAAEEICRQLTAVKNMRVECFSAGIDRLATVPVNEEMASKADLIFVMEEYMGEILRVHLAQDPKKVICLDIPDIYSRFDPKLEALIKRKLKRYI